MRIHADKTLCIAAGQCVLSSPAVFDQDDDDTIRYAVSAFSSGATVMKPTGSLDPWALSVISSWL